MSHLNRKKIYSSLHHPLLLLIIGALISSYIIPFYTRAWQDHQKELELKTDLVGEISNSVATILIKTQTTKAIISTPYKEFYNAFEEWESGSAIIQSELRAYFFNSHLPQLWTNYSFILSDFAFLSISANICARANYIEEIQKYFNIHQVINRTEINNCAMEFDRSQQISTTPFAADLEAIDWDELIKHGNDTKLSSSWLALKQNIITQKDRIIQEILDLHIQAFS